MSGTLPALLRLVSVPRRRLAAAAVLGALTVVFGVGLMATSGYLISRAAEQPPILSLMVAVAAVQAFGLGRPIVRYLERLASHDVALRSLGRLRTRFYERIEPLAPGGARELSHGRPARAHGRRRRRAAEPVPARPAARRIVALMAGAVAVGVAAAFLPAAGARARRGPARRRTRRAGAVGRSRRLVRAGARPPRAVSCRRSSSSCSGAAPSSSRSAAGEPALARIRAADASLVRLAPARRARRPASATARACSSPASRSPACSPSPSRRRPTDGSTTC